MSESGTDEQRGTDGPQNAGPLSPAALAERVAMLGSEDAGIRGGALPMWGRLDQRASQSGWRRLASQLVVAVAWCGILGLLVVALLRIFWHDGNVPLTLLNAFTLYLYLPAYAVLALAAWTRHWWLATVSAAVVACHVVWVAPDFRPATLYVPPSANTMSAPTSLRIFHVNVLGNNQEFKAMMHEAAGTDPDVIVLSELHRPWVRYLKESEMIKSYPYGTNMNARYPGDVVVFSRMPVTRRQVIVTGGRALVVLDVRVGEENVRLFCLHAPRPTPDTADAYREFWSQVEAILAEEQGPLVVLGDFNATQHSLVYKQLNSGRLRSAHVDRGRGYVTTWPNRKNPIPPIRIDQVLLSPEIECISIAEGEGPGSDHKPLILDIRVHSAAPAGSER